MAIKISKTLYFPENMIYDPNESTSTQEWMTLNDFELELAKKNYLLAYTYEFNEEEKKMVKNYFFSDYKQALLFYTSVLNNLEYTEIHLSNLQHQKNKNFTIQWDIDFDYTLSET